MNLGEYRIEALERAGVPAGDTQTIPAATANRAINGALKHIASVASWPWLFVEEEVVLPAGASFFYPPQYWTSTQYLGTDGYYLRLASLSDVQGALRYNGGRPRLWVALGDKILVGPSTTDERTLLHGFYRSEPLLVADNDAPLLPDEHSEWLINEATIRLVIRTANTDRLAQLREEAATARRATMANVRRTTDLPRIRRTKPSVWSEG